MKQRQIVLIAHDIRSTHNVGSLLRTAEGFGVNHVYFTGYTPYPETPNDARLPHIAAKLSQQIHKTALGAENIISWSHEEGIANLFDTLRQEGYKLLALEQTAKSVGLPDYNPPDKVAILLGREVEGIEPSLIRQCDGSVEIPMFGKKESFNVVQAAAIALYHCRFL